MSYGFEPGNRRRKAAGGGGLIFLVVLGIGAFLLFNTMRQAPNPEGPNLDPVGNSDTEWRDQDRSDARSNPMPKIERHEDSNDFEMSEVPIKDSDSGQARTKSTQNDDWGMEEVETKDKNKNQFEISDRGNNKVVPDAKSTRKGDWGMDEINEKKDN